MRDENDVNQTVLLLQSGGRDSAIAAINLLEKGFNVAAITFSAYAAQHIKKPRKRAIEISENYSNYSWNMVEFGKWENALKNDVTGLIDDVMPRSCLLCALSKITAAISICNKMGYNKIAMGYADYQSDWAEQTPYAIKLQKNELEKHGIELILPAQDISSKTEAITTLSTNKLSPDSLENPCCISKWGTQPVSDDLIKQSIDLSFAFHSKNNPELEVVDHIGEIIRCH